MKNIDELNLQPGETLFVDGIRDGIARLVIGEEGERVETVDVSQLPEGCREAGAYLCVGSGGDLRRHDERGQVTREEIDSLMGDIFGSPPPE